MDSLLLELDWPPSLNTYYPSFMRGGRLSRVTSTKGKHFRKAVKEDVDTADVGSFGSARLRVRALLHPPDERKRDIDNHVKPILDALKEAGLFDDDSQVDSLQVDRGEIVTYGASIVEISVLNREPIPYAGEPPS